VWIFGDVHAGRICNAHGGILQGKKCDKSDGKKPQI